MAEVMLLCYDLDIIHDAIVLPAISNYLNWLLDAESSNSVSQGTNDDKQSRGYLQAFGSWGELPIRRNLFGSCPHPVSWKLLWMDYCKLSRAIKTEIERASLSFTNNGWKTAKIQLSFISLSDELIKILTCVKYLLTGNLYYLYRIFIIISEFNRITFLIEDIQVETGWGFLSFWTNKCIQNPSWRGSGFKLPLLTK